MDHSSNPAATSVNTDPVELIVAYGHRLKLHRVTSKDKKNNDVISTNTDQEKKKSISKLPRVVKTPFHSNLDKHLDNSGDTLAGSSKPKNQSRNQSPHAQKLKGSHIPRRKILQGSVRKENPPKHTNASYFVPESQRIQRLHVPNISPDFHQADHMPTTSIGSTRPIPTLGQIYRRNNIIIDGDRFYDWFMELDTPVNSLESNPRNTQQRPSDSNESTDTAQSVIDVEITKPYYPSNKEKAKVVFDANVYKTTNDNISDWLATEADYSGKDNESGYRSMSPHSRGAINIEPKHSDDTIVKQSNENYCLALGKTSERFENETEGDAAVGATAENNTDVPLVEQPTVVISRLNEETKIEPVYIENNITKIDIALEPIVMCKSERSMNLQFPSKSGTQSKDEKQAVAPSYVDCPSEVLQKTTNFEGDGCDSPNTLSSIAATDLEIRDDYSSLYTLENVDDCNLEDHPGHATWCPGCRSQSCMTFVKSGETDDATQMQNAYCGCHGDRHGSLTSEMECDNRAHGEKRHNFCHSCGRKTSQVRHGDSRGYCKRHSRYRRFPSNRYRLTRPFDSLRKKLSIKRICRHRWNHVWKKTAARWNNWSKSHSKLGKYRMLEYLRSSIIWEDVDVQTMVLLFKETGTYTTVMEQKSAGISTSIKNTSKKTDTGGIATSARSFKSRFKHINLGPSRFPFFYNAKRRSMPLQNVEEAYKPLPRFNSYPETQNKLIETKAIEEKLTLSKDTSIGSGFAAKNADTSSIKLMKSGKCSRPTKDGNTSPIEKKKSKKSFVICKCPNNPSIQVNPTVCETVTNIHQLKTIDTGTEDLAMFFPNTVTEFTSPVISMQEYDKLTNFGIHKKYRDACAGIALSSNNIDNIVPSDTHFTVSVGYENINVPFYKPCGINTDLKNMESKHQDIEYEQSTSTSPIINTNLSGSSKHTNKKSVSLKLPTQSLDSTDRIDSSTGTREKNFVNTGCSTSVLCTEIVSKYAPNTENNNKIDLGTNISQPNFTRTESPIRVNLGTEISRRRIISTDNTNKNNLATGTSQPHLTSTDAKVTTISSAQMLAASVITSQKDIPLTVGYQNFQVKVSASCQCDTPFSLGCRCNECSVESTGKVHTQLHVNKSTASPVDVKEDKITGSSFIAETKQYRDFSSQALIEKRSQVVEAETSAAVSKKSAYVFTALETKSASAVTSSKRTKSVNMVTCEVEDHPESHRVSVSTNTSHHVERRSIGLSSAAMPTISPMKQISKPTIDTWVQYSHILEQNDKPSFRSARIGHSKLISMRHLNDSNFNDCETEPLIHPSSHYKTIAVMTSGPFDEASNTADAKENRKNALCSCAQVGCDMETSTLSDLKPQRRAECSTQVFRSMCNQSLDKATCSSYEDYTPNQPANARNVGRTAADQLTSLSRLIGQVRSGSQIASISTQPITSKILSSNLDAAKWIKRCTNNDEKDYQSLIDIEQSTLETLKQASMSIANSSRSAKMSTRRSLRTDSKIKPNALCSLNSVARRACPITALSKDSLADVLPANSLTKKHLPTTEIKKMADKVTSDDIMSKPIKESILQACPDINDTGTDAAPPNIDYLKSACALTSRCVLPPPLICCDSNNHSTDCIFVYDKPRCAIHKTRLDASVQISERGSYVREIAQDLESRKREHAIDQLEIDTHHLEAKSFQNKNTSNVIGQVLPPKVYKALYETTKLVVKDSCRQPIKTVDPDIENEAAIIRALAIRSAAILTSQCGLCPSEHLCNCNKMRTDQNIDKTEYVYTYNTPYDSLAGSTQTCATCQARLLDIPHYYQPGMVEERVKTQLLGSCRYYSNLLTKRLGRVKEKVTRHLVPPTDHCLYYTTAVPKLSYTEACTMKPSGREDLGCQTARHRIPSLHRIDYSKPLSCCALSPSMTNICEGPEKHHLKSVYYMLSAIEGRIRRLKRNIPN